MGLLFLSDEGQDFVAVVEEVTQRVEDLGLRDAEGFGDFENSFAPLVQRNHVADGHAQAVDQWLAAADAFATNDVWVFGLHRFGHADSPEN
jgi:hypothetical protein